MVCIGPGPGPKNVLADVGGKLVVYPYAIWKHKIKGVKLAGNEYQLVIGNIQQFGDKDWLNEREVAGQTVREFTVKSAVSGNFVKVQLWPEYAGVELAPGAFVSAEGPVQVNDVKGTTYRNLTARRLSVVLPAEKVEADDAPKKVRKGAKDAPL